MWPVLRNIGVFQANNLAPVFHTHSDSTPCATLAVGCGPSTSAAELASVGGVPTGSGAADAAVASMLGDSALCSQVELSVSAVGLPKLDVLSQSDPIAVLYELLPNDSEREIARTEIVVNSNAPSFVQRLRVSFRFEEVQRLAVRFYDVDTDHIASSANINVNAQEYMGEVRCQLSEIMGARGSFVRLNLTNSAAPTRAKGIVTIVGEETKDSNANFTVQLACEKLANKDTFGKSDPFIRISRGMVPVFKTEVVMNNLNPTFRPFTVCLQRLAGGDPYRPLSLDVFDWNSSGTHAQIGSVAASADDMVKRATSREPFPIVNPSEASKKGAAYTNSGLLRVVSAAIKPQPSFLDYIVGGCEMNFMVAIDFTASNGDPSLPESLHYQSPAGIPNPYQIAIRAVGSVLEFYDSDRIFPVYGFGGKPFPGSPVSHCFALSDGSGHPGGCIGVSGIMAAYNAGLSTCRLSGPTHFGSVLDAAVGTVVAADVSQFNQKYFVLLIITDGTIMDFDATVAKLVDASNLPLSVLIVGVGSADFGQMEALDADDVRLSSGFKVAARDTVQFVPMARFVGTAGGNNPLDSPNVVTSLSRALLAELPDQVTQYFGKAGITPNPRPPPAATAPPPSSVPPRAGVGALF